MGPPTPHVLSDTCDGGYLITTGMTVQFSLLELAFSPHSYLWTACVCSLFSITYRRDSRRYACLNGGGECVVNRQHSGTGCKGFGISASQTLPTLLLLFHLLRSQLQGVASVTTTRDSVLLCIYPIQISESVSWKLRWPRSLSWVVPQMTASWHLIIIVYKTQYDIEYYYITWNRHLPLF